MMHKNKNSYFQLEEIFYHIENKPRSVYISKEFSKEFNNICNKDTIQKLQTLIDKIKNGDDLNPYLTTNYEKGKYDLLHRKYKIYHLHLLAKPQRDSNRMFIVFTNNSAFLLQIDTKHDDKRFFQTNELLEIIFNNYWGYLLPTVNIPLGKIPNIAQETRNLMNKKGFSFVNKICDKAIMTLGGVSDSKGNLVAVDIFIYNQFLQWIKTDYIPHLVKTLIDKDKCNEYKKEWIKNNTQEMKKPININILYDYVDSNAMNDKEYAEVLCQITPFVYRMYNLTLQEIKIVEGA